MPQIIEAVKRGVMQEGGMAFVFPTISIGESFAHPTSMYLRNLMALDTEEMMRAQPVDAVVLLGGCGMTIPAQLMAEAGYIPIPKKRATAGVKEAVRFGFGFRFPAAELPPLNSDNG